MDRERQVTIEKPFHVKRSPSQSSVSSLSPQEPVAVVAERDISRSLFLALAVLVVLVLTLWPLRDRALGGDHYVHLARSFADGTLNVDQMSTRYRDYVEFQGHKYLPFGPLPALLLVPFVWLLDAGVHLVAFSYALTVLNVFLMLRVVTRAGIAEDLRRWVVLLFFGGSVYLSVTLS